MVSLTIPQKLMLNNSTISAAVNGGAIGLGGTITIYTPNLVLDRNGAIEASTVGQGSANSVTINGANQALGIPPGSILEILNGSQIRTNTSSAFNAGNITVNFDDLIKIDGEDSGIFSNTTPGSTGNGGSITIDPNNVLITNGGAIAVNSQGTGQGGDITLFANNLIMNDRASITATSVSSEGGTITLNLRDLLFFRQGSAITASSGTEARGGGGNGGGYYH